MNIERPDEELKQTQNLMRLLYERFKKDENLDNDHKESLAYRMAEIMSSAKNLYTQILPRMTDEQNGDNMLELLSDFRLHYLNLSDIITEFDDLFLSSIVQEEGAILPDSDTDNDNYIDEEYEADEDTFSQN